MKFETAFNCGDLGWIYYGSHIVGVQQATIGKIKIEYVDTVLYEDSETGYGEPVVSYKEVYMCKETGIVSGTIFTLGEHIFKTKEEAEIGFRHHIEEEAARMLAVQTKERNDLLNKEKYLRSQLARIEAIKLEEIK